MREGNHKKRRLNAMDKAEKIMDLLMELIKSQFSGTISIGFNRGGITRIEKNEDILKNTMKPVN